MIEITIPLLVLLLLTAFLFGGMVMDRWDEFAGPVFAFAAVVWFIFLGVAGAQLFGL